MRAARIVILGIALAAGGAAALLAGRGSPPPPVVEAAAPAPVKLPRVLVANTDLGVGTALAAKDVRWQDWPTEALSPVYITEAATPDAVKEWTGAVTRAPFVAGEPLRAQKLIKGDGSGFLSAILPAGMRAVATAISLDSAAGGFILPNDRVDVILTRQDQDALKQGNAGAWLSQTVLRNVRVLAVDQTVEEQNGQKVITGSTATLELVPKQAELLALARQMGKLSLTLRSLSDNAPGGLAGAGPETGDPLDTAPAPGGASLSVVRYGVSTNVSGH